MKAWILAGVLIVLMITSAVVITMLLLDAQERRKERERHSEYALWKLEMWNTAKGYCVHLQFQGSMVIGRNELFPIGQQEQDITVSRQHCMLYEQQGLLLVWNLSAVNPANLNGYRLNAPQLLRTGDRLKMGSSVFLITRIECA